jgi:ankyrin repeat protein
MTNENTSDEKENKSFWNTTIGTITKITALLSAITGLVLAVKPLFNSSKQEPTTVREPKNAGGNSNGTPKEVPPTKYIPTANEITAFLDDAKTGNIDGLKSKLALGIEPDINLIGDPTTALINAIDNNRSEAVKLLLENKANPNNKVRGNSYPIIEASFWGRTEIVKMLIQYKADVNVRKQDGSGITSLMFASINGHKDVVQGLIDSGAEVDLKAVNNSTALDFANASANGIKGQIIAILNSVGAHSGF